MNTLREDDVGLDGDLSKHLLGLLDEPVLEGHAGLVGLLPPHGHGQERPQVRVGALHEPPLDVRGLGLGEAAGAQGDGVDEPGQLLVGTVGDGAPVDRPEGDLEEEAVAVVLTALLLLPAHQLTRLGEGYRVQVKGAY